MKRFLSLYPKVILVATLLTIVLSNQSFAGNICDIPDYFLQFTKFLREGDRGNEVEYLQIVLNAEGHNAGAEDGMFGPNTKAAVKRFQEAEGLAVDGLVGQNTRRELNKVLDELRVSPPTLVSPSDNSTIDTTTPTFRWNEASNADYYALFISKYPYGSSNLVFNSKEDYGPIYGSSFTLPNGIFEDRGRYRWNMSSHNSGGWSCEYSEAWDFTVEAPSQISVTPTSLTNSCQERNNASSQSFEVWNSGDGTLSYSVTDNVWWLSCSPTSGTSTGEQDTITLNYNSSGLSEGNYSATITISDPNASNSPKTISVSLTVNPPEPEPMISRSPTSLTNSCRERNNASSQSFEVWNSGDGTLSYSVTDNVWWLSCSPTSGTSTGEQDTITLNYNSSGLSEGNYSATITISDPNASNSPKTISVSLTVNPPEPQHNPTITITTPSSDPHDTVSTPITISGTCSDEDDDLSSVKVENSANGHQDTQSVSGGSDNFSFSVPLNGGGNLITITVYDSGDRTGSDTITVNLARNPEVTITYPPSDPYNTDSTPITISGTCGDADGDLVRIKVVNNANGYEKDTMISGDSSTFSFSGLPLVEGDNPIEVTVYDSGDGTGTDTITVIYVPGETISGTVTDGTTPIAATVQAWQNGSLVASTDSSDGSYSLSGLSAAEYAVRAYSKGYYAKAYEGEVMASASGVDIALEPVPDILSSPVTPCDFWDQDGTTFDEPTEHIPEFVQIGDVITAKDPDGVICGLAYVGDAGTDEGDYLIHVLGDDPNTTGVDEGASEGDTISFFINGSPAKVISGTPVWNSGGSHKVSLSAPALSSGDVSGDGAVTAYDAALVLQHLSGLITLSASQQDRGDVDGEVGISASDAELILHKVVGTIGKF